MSKVCPENGKPASVGRPESGVTAGQPFAPGTAGSDNFRIPALVTLPDGSLLAAADARWDHQDDACSLDTIVSISRDNGATWTYNFPNHFDDSVNAAFYEATAFIDPVVVVDREGTVHLVVDAYPGGVGLNTAPVQPARSTGFVEVDGVERMMVYETTDHQTDDNYTHYVGDFAEGFAPVIAREGGGVTAYVDDHFYLYDTDKKKLLCRQIGSENQVHQNLFYTNARLHVRNAAFLWLVSSRDGGHTWSAPTILNPMVRRTEGTDQFYGVGPGAGLCLSDGTLMLPCYTFTAGGEGNNGQIASFIYSTDNGRTWARSQNATSGGHWSSESALVEIDRNTVRQFYRDGSTTLTYTDHTRQADGTWRAGESVDTGVPKDRDNQLSAIRCSRPVSGRTAILVSTATVHRRTNGRLYTFALNEDNTMELVSAFVVNRDNFAYSSLTELTDGSIGLLYERTPEVVFVRCGINKWTF